MQTAKYTLSIILGLCSLWTHAQYQFSGKVYDVGNREPIENAQLNAKASRQLLQTNAQGNFNLSTNPIHQLDSNQQLYISSLNNRLHWRTGNSVDLTIYNTYGQLLLQHKGAPTGFLNLPPMSSGIYILRLKSGSQEISIKLNRSNSKYVGPIASDPIAMDSFLTVSKDQYYSEEVPLNNSQLSIPMLKFKYDSLDYFNELTRYEAFEMINGSPPITNYGEVWTVKVLLDIKTDSLYYINTKKYNTHFSFAKRILNFPRNSAAFYNEQFENGHYKFASIGTINYHRHLDKYVLELASYNLEDCAGIKRLMDKISATSYLKGKLYFYPNNLRWEQCSDISLITSEELFNGQNYQALNVEEGYGYLRLIDIDTFEKTYFHRHDIPILNGIPNDISVVAGIITTAFQPPLSHINVLCTNRKTPHMALKNVLSDSSILKLVGKLVYMKVGKDTFTIRTADTSESNPFWREREPWKTVTLELDSVSQEIVNLTSSSIQDVKKIGGKAANFAELVNIGSVPLPEVYFAIPFYYYTSHLRKLGIDTLIRNTLGSSQFQLDVNYRKKQLEFIRSKIEEITLDPAFVAQVYQKIDSFKTFQSFKFRSSTNAEDLPFFSGAGLYDSYSAKKDHQKKTVERAIKKVWASLWNFRAFEEREYYKIDHLSTAMGILVNRSFSNEDANGVAVTKNLFNSNHGYTINVQFKEYSIVTPGPGTRYDQILIYEYNFGTDSSKYTYEYLSRSNIPELNGKTVLSDSELEQLAEICKIIKDHYYYNLPNNCNCDYTDFAMDLELKIDSSVKHRKLYIKQARVYSN